LRYAAFFGYLVAALATTQYFFFESLDNHICILSGTYSLSSPKSRNSQKVLTATLSRVLPFEKGGNFPPFSFFGLPGNLCFCSNVSPIATFSGVRPNLTCGKFSRRSLAAPQAVYVKSQILKPV
jgi:hypothetical protein